MFCYIETEFIAVTPKIMTKENEQPVDASREKFVEHIARLYVDGIDNAHEKYVRTYGDRDKTEATIDYVRRCAGMDFINVPLGTAVYQDAADEMFRVNCTLRSGRFTVDDTGFMHLASVKILSAVALGKLDLNLAARQEMATRGLDAEGNWVGFKQAACIHALGRGGTEENATQAPKL